MDEFGMFGWQQILGCYFRFELIFGFSGDDGVGVVELLIESFQSSSNYNTITSN